MTTQPSFEVDRRVGIALGALSSEERAAIEPVIASESSFEEAAAEPGRVEILSATSPTSGTPLRMMRATPTLRLIFTQVGQTTHVLDLIDRATLRHLATQRPKVTSTPQRPGLAVES